jgi:hypothetical protein
MACAPYFPKDIYSHETQEKYPRQPQAGRHADFRQFPNRVKWDEHNNDVGDAVEEAHAMNKHGGSAFSSLTQH